MSFDKYEETLSTILPFDSSLLLFSCSFLRLDATFSTCSVKFLEHFVMVYRCLYQQDTYLNCLREPPGLRKHIV